MNKYFQINLWPQAYLDQQYIIVLHVCLGRKLLDICLKLCASDCTLAPKR